ncbi:transposase [Geobacillus stearothermophilus 10]|nr:transposase [Geobacillus stearothermophilus 10]
MARPSKADEWLTEENLLVIEGWARDGLTDEQISQNMGISTSTLYEWKKKYPKFSEALKRGKEVVDRQVENALLKRALGYEYDEITYENGKEVKRVRKQVQPDTTAQIFWLKNRKPLEWRDKPENDQLKRIVELLSRLNLSQEEINELLKEMSNNE